ncbi:hypothetical protein [Commensalibacter oyaizuii]|uniref:Uncharacterized protein n=1 Tax=Commensalibacter oyaizuii TaxID=3043873 RepID=A0ABT6Q3I8_9PROT|nr:hypothetical protein [Commensalibacter sp. TBRC 16381]MDI2091681.1 hypothetical protein [Commensalibacter sp. TBRC 16381]
MFKAGIVGGLTFIIAIGVVISTVSVTAKQLQNTAIKVKKIPAYLMFFIVWLVGWAVIYWLFSEVGVVDTPEKARISTIYVCLFALMPSFAMVLAALVYYLDVRTALTKSV